MQYSPLQEKQREARGQKAADWRKAPEVQAASSVAGLKPQHTSHEIYYAYLKEAVEKEPHSSIEKANEQAAKAMLRDKRPIRQIRECLLCAPNVKALPNTFKQKEAVEKLMKTIQKEKKNDQNHELSR